MKTIDQRARDCVAWIRAYDAHVAGRLRAPAEKDRDDAEYIARAISLAITAERRAVKRERV